MKSISSLIILLFIAFFSTSCEDVIKYSKPNKIQKIAPGEWFNVLDSTAGISVRENKLGIIEKMTTTSDQIYSYSIIDSIESSGNVEKITGTYLFLEGRKDTLFYPYFTPEDSIIELNINNKKERFKWKLITQFK